MKKRVAAFLTVIAISSLCACSAPNVSSAETTSVAPVESSSSNMPAESMPVTSSLSNEEKAAIDKAEALLAEAETLFENGEYKAAIEKINEIQAFYKVTSYTDVINLTMLNILGKSQRAMGYANQDYMRSNVFSSVKSGTIPLNNKIRGFFYDYTRKNQYTYLPAFVDGAPEFQDVLLYAYFFCLNPSNDITEKQVQDFAEKYFGGFPYAHQKGRSFNYQDGIYTPTGWSLDWFPYFSLTELTRRTENGKTLYTATWDIYEFFLSDIGDTDSNTKYLKALMKDSAYAGMDEEQIVGQLITEGKTENLASSGKLVVEFEAVDTGSEIYFLLHSVNKTFT